MTKFSTVLSRLEADATPREEWRDKCHRIRRVLGGDLSQFIGGVNDATEEEARQSRRRENTPDYLVRSLETGRSNELLKAVKTLHQQSSFNRPLISFAGVDSEESAFMEAYFAARTGPKPTGCDAHSQLQAALMSYLVDGIGWVGLVFDKYGRLAIQHFDTIDMIWDRGPALISDARWAAAIDRKPLGYWKQKFGSGGAMVEASHSVGDNDDRPVEMAFYYDCEGDDGHFAVAMVSGEDKYFEKPIFEDKNPFYLEHGGYRQPFLPFEAATFLQLPSMAYPIGMVEQAIPHQFALLAADRAIRDTLFAVKPITLYDPAAFSADDVKKLERGDSNPYIKVKKDVLNGDNVPIRRVDGFDVPEGVVLYRNIQDQALTAQTGANPYSSGDKVEGIQYASEVNAIQQSASLTAATVSKDHARQWERIAKKYMSAAAIHDDVPCEFIHDGTIFEFGPEMPVKELLRPEATPVARQDTIRYMSEEQEVAMAQQLLQAVLPLQAMYPQAVEEAMSKYLTAAGVQNVSDWMQKPPQMMPQMAPGMADGGSPEAPGAMSA